MTVLLKAIIVLSVILLLVAAATTGCQQLPESTPPAPAPATPNSSETQPEYVPDQIIVKFQDGTSIEAQEQLHQKLGTKVIHTSPSAGFQVLQVPEGKTVEEMVTLYSEQFIVEYAEPNYIEHLNSEAQ
jgi:hypothetical protein